MKLKDTLQEKSLLTHPFYKLWLEGKLPLESLQRYSEQYFHLVDHLPRFVGTLYVNSNDINVRKQLIIQMAEEELGQDNGDIAHSDLWLDFAQGIGVSKKEVEMAPILDETQAVLDTLYNACNTSLIAGASALYAYEGQVPEIADEKIKGLKECYNITDNKTLRFFALHSVVDKKHRDVWTDMVEQFATTDKQKEASLQAARQTKEALWTMFDAMYEHFVPESVKCAC